MNKTVYIPCIGSLYTYLDYVGVMTDTDYVFPSSTLALYASVSIKARTNYIINWINTTTFSVS